MRKSVTSEQSKATGSDGFRGHALATVALATAVAWIATACASTGPFIWFHDLPQAEWGSSTDEYVIGVGDSLSIRVYDQDAFTTQSKVRTDGRIAMPLVGETVVAGKHPLQLARELEVRLKEFVVTPRVTVNVEQSQPITITTLGEVGHIGSITLEPKSGLLQALAQAGGFTQFADKSKIFVLRKFPKFQRIRFTYDGLVHNEGRATTFSLQAGDVIVVE